MTRSISHNTFRPKSHVPPTSLDSKRSRSIRWVPPGASFVVDNHRVTGGFVYVGGAARSWDFDAVEPSMIDPDRPVDWQRPDRDGSSIPAWPSYVGLSPRCRAGFLQWLAGGRRDPEAHDGFPLLLLAGLERRLLEIGIDDGHPDVDCITTEVRALLDHYGPGRAIFARSARSLLTRVDSVRLIDTDNPPPVWDPGHVPITIPVSVSDRCRPFRRHRNTDPARVGTGSRSEDGFFGFTERGWSPAPWAGASVFMEIATAALATAALASEVRADHTPTALRSSKWSPPPPT